ncbi:hypothetical protein DO97_10895 [Neosynechococcus sphagnicola sy1]|uniref:Uncharacterized protein n=2 Tax=Neosynechococcus TaxID=1501143 RepID=A0A098TI48_9CYAN|nr:hypothetical protein DO97_10895 [Neosynechococcus sphagnicola sy1]
MPRQLPPKPPSPDVEETPDSPPEPADPETMQTDPNPLNPAGDSLDQLIKLRFNDDAWQAMLGELPCLTASEPCIRQLQGLAVQNSTTLKEIDQRLEAINEKIDQARKNNQATVRLGVFEPLVQRYLSLENVTTIDNQGRTTTQQRGFLDRLASLFIQPLTSINEILSLVGLPLFRNQIGGDPAAQQRSIAIADLQVKVAEIIKGRAEIADKIREQVILTVLDFDQTRREFQISQEVAKRETLRTRLIEVDYRFGQGDTVSYLGNLSALDRQKAQAFREWARLRSQLARIKILVLGVEE